MTLNKFVTTDEVMSLTLVWFNRFRNSEKKKKDKKECGKKPLHFNKWGYGSVNESADNTPARQKAYLEQTGLPYLFFSLYNAQYWIKLQPLFINFVYWQQWNYSLLTGEQGTIAKYNSPVNTGKSEHEEDEHMD